jgi:hypothetical protein
MTLTGRELGEVIARNLRRTSGIASLSGVRALATCQGGETVVALTRPDGRAVHPDERLIVLTSDFLATGGDGLFAPASLRSAHFASSGPIRDAIADHLRRRGGSLDANAPDVFSRARPRLVFSGQRPVRCPR